MATKTSFTREEWNRILESVMLSGMAVTAADPSGLLGVLGRIHGNGRTLLAAKADPNSNELIKAVVSDFESGEGRQAARTQVQSRLKGVAVAEMKNQSIAALREISQLLDSKAPSDAAGFQDLAASHCRESAAEASAEGGFMGFGGTQVSEAEKATLAELAARLWVFPLSRTRFIPRANPCLGGGAQRCARRGSPKIPAQRRRRAWTKDDGAARHCSGTSAERRCGRKDGRSFSAGAGWTWRSCA